MCWHSDPGDSYSSYSSSYSAPCYAQPQPSAEEKRLKQEIQRKDAEIAKLRAQLMTAEATAKLLAEENAKLKQGQQSSSPALFK